jgi:competence ComEA-like helix-hairpin-helix protein
VEVIVGVGPIFAEAIVDYRAAFGAVEGVCSFVKVEGIGVALTEKKRDSIKVHTGQDSDC